MSITIRNVPTETHDALASRAARSGYSLQKYLRLQLNELAARPDMGAAIASIRARAQEYPAIMPSEIMENLEADSR